MIEFLHRIPVSARVLGFGGLIPFMAAAGLLLSPDPSTLDLARRALMAYGAIILSFLGGVRWGLAMALVAPHQLLRPLAVSVVPSILGWISLLLPNQAGLYLLIACYGLMVVADIRLTTAPIWYKHLRVALSTGAIAAMTFGAVI